MLSPNREDQPCNQVSTPIARPPTAYQCHIQRYFDECAPQGSIETQLVQTIADTAWRMNRVTALEANLLTTGMITHAAAQLTTEQAASDALAIAASISDQSRALATISQHEQRLVRQFHTSIARLREVQAERLQREQRLLRHAAAVFETHKRKGLPYEPAEDGFVFSKEQIETHVERTNRRNQSRPMAKIPDQTTPPE